MTDNDATAELYITDALKTRVTPPAVGRKEESAVLQGRLDALEAELARVRRAGGWIYTRDFVAGVAHAVEMARGGDR